MMDEDDLPLISIIIPVKPGGYVKALESIKRLDYPVERLELFVSEGSQPSRQRNEAVKASKGDILYFLDDDSCPEPGNLKRLAGHFKNPLVAVAGGPSIIPESDTFLQHRFADLFTSPMGGAGVRNRYQRVGSSRETTERELILCNLGFRADVYKKMGGLNEKLYPNEENELMSRIQDEGLLLIHDPDLLVYRSHRKTVSAFIRQMLNYGRGRMEQTIISPSSFSAAHFIPLIFLLYFLSLFATFNPLYTLPMALYLVLALLFSVKGGMAESANAAVNLKKPLFVLLLFPVMHLSYGAGLLWGIKRAFGFSVSVESEVKVNRINDEPGN